MSFTARTPIRARVLPRWPAQIVGNNGVKTTRTGGRLTVSLGTAELTEELAPTNDWFIAAYDPDGVLYRKISFANMFSSVSSVTLAQISDMSADARTFNAAANNAAMRTALGVPALAHTHILSQISDMSANAQSFNAAANYAAMTVLLSDFTTSAKGMAPASGGGTSNFLRADGSWAVPPGTSALPLYAGFVNNMEIVASVSSNALTIALKTAANADASAGDPITFVFPSATEADGSQTTRTLDAASSIVISSGSTLGTANSTAFRFWLVMFDDGGTLRLGVINCRGNNSSVFKLGGWGRASSTAEGGAGAADSSRTFYTGSAVTNMPYIVLGFVEYGSGLATAGTYASAPTRIRMHQRGMKLPGDVVQMAGDVYTTNADSTAVIPIDNSTPQDTEGAQIISFSMANDSACNVNWIGYGGFGGMNATTSLVMAVFHNGSASAVHAAAQTASSGNVAIVSGEGFIFVGSASALTWQLRYGPGTAATARLNGTTAGALLPSAAATYFRNWEIMA